VTAKMTATVAAVCEQQGTRADVWAINSLEGGEGIKPSHASNGAC
jgi:hypothetical protein